MKCQLCGGYYSGRVGDHQCYRPQNHATPLRHIVLLWFGMVAGSAFLYWEWRTTTLGHALVHWIERMQGK